MQVKARNQRLIRRQLEDSDIWIELMKDLDEYGIEYAKKYKYPLLMQDLKPELKTKPFESLIEKTFRKNILENKKNWPEPPGEGWILPSNWFFKINDIIRTTIVVKYLDGIGFIADKTRLLSKKYGLEYKIEWKSREEGYYAAHQYIKKEFKIPDINLKIEEVVNMSIEIQITTQLQENIRPLLHEYYEKRRKRVSEEDIKWQWDYKSEEFAANYLEHILHYIEGIILEIRDKQDEKI